MKKFLAILLIVLIAGCAQPAQKPIESATGRFSMDVDDNGYYMNGTPVSAIAVKKGTTVSITMTVRTTGVYFSGLSFKGCGQSVMNVNPGTSANITFAPSGNCDILTYWPDNGAPKKTLSVIVE